MTAVVADTHAAIWYLLHPERLSPRAVVALDDAAASGDPVYMSAISFVEVIYLVEKGRLPEAALLRLHHALTDPEPPFVVAPLDMAVAQAMRSIPREVVPDMPDRIIAATALHLHVPLISRDRHIQMAEITTIW
jgi:PIN domain nuclease of toxin-antitoxin system